MRKPTIYTNVPLTSVRRVYPDNGAANHDVRSRSQVGKSTMKRVMDAFAAGHRVEVKTYYVGEHEHMDATIFWGEPT